jgi:hypothetical protein
MGGKFMDNSTEQRLSKVESAIRELQEQKTALEPNWLKEITGSFADDPIFDQVMAYGREIRQADSFAYAEAERLSDDEESDL